MATVIEFKLSDLIVATLNNTTYSLEIKIQERPEENTWTLNAQGEREWEVFPAIRDDYLTITTIEGEQYSFDNSIKHNTDLYFWVFDTQHNNDHINLLNELEVPYQRV